jgi:hypothetical protein
MVSASFEPFFPQQAKRLVQMTSPSIQVFQLSILREAAVAVTLHCSEEHYFALLIRTPMVGSCSVPRHRRNTLGDGASSAPGGHHATR